MHKLSAVENTLHWRSLVTTEAGTVKEILKSEELGDLPMPAADRVRLR